VLTVGAMQRLEPLIGEWSLEVTFPGAHPIGGASTVFEWALGGQFVIQRTSNRDTEVPDSLIVIGAGTPDGYTQHYFDSRGVVRVYEMTFADGEWTLLRDRADSSPLEFSQRFVGSLSEDARTIDGHWQKRTGPEDWLLDFALTYRRG